jgi:hypothetical protein
MKENEVKEARDRYTLHCTGSDEFSVALMAGTIIQN